jgi:hypothetical protein
MAARFTPKIRNFVASSLIDNITLQQLPEWTELTPYIEGNQAFYGDNVYICKDSGTSGSIPPTHVNGSASDGGIEWIWVEAISTTQMFKRNLFVALGKKTEWANELIPDDAEVHDLNDFAVIQNAMTLKRVSSGDFRIAVKRYNWTSGVIYSQYDDSKDPLAIDGPDSYDSPFYVFTDDNNIYKCIDNNNGALSTSKPTDIGTSITALADGYVWKYMGSLDADSVYFLTKDFIPVKFKVTDDGSNQWDVQQAAKKQSLSTFKILNKTGNFPSTMTVTVSGGSPLTPAQAFATKNSGDNTLKQILVNPSAIGEGYDMTQEVIAIVKRSSAVGSGGTVGAITVLNGEITNITVGNAGTGYTGGAVLVLYDPVGGVTEEADIDVVITGSNTIQEFTINDGGAGYSTSVRGYVIAGPAGGVGKAVFAPKEGHGYNIVTELCANTAIINVRLSEETEYLAIGEDNAFRQVSLITDVVEKDTFIPAYSPMYLGPSHESYGSLTLNNIDANRGYVLYTNNLKKVIRDNGQEEDIKICVTF